MVLPKSGRRRPASDELLRPQTAGLAAVYGQYYTRYPIGPVLAIRTSTGSER